MKLSFVKFASALALAGALVAGPAMIVSAQTADPLKARKDNRQELRKSMGAIKGVVDAKGDAKTIAPMAEGIVKLEQAHMALYPAGSDKGETKALPVIWTDMAGFRAASKATEDAAANLAKVAAAGDIAGAGAAFGALGATCGGCHDKYRAK